MKVASTSTLNYEPTYTKASLKNDNPGTGIKTASSCVSFGGAMQPVNGLFKFIEKTGFFMQFLIVDTLSMVLPRTIVGFNRDRDKLGHPNYQAAAEEFGRESLSGPSMNLIPMLLASIFIHKAMPTVKLEQDVIEGINYNLNDLISKNPNHPDLTDKTKLSRKLAEQIFDDAFGGDNFKLANKSEYRTKFADLLETASKTNPKLALIRKLQAKNPDEFDKAEKAFDELVVEMHNKNTAAESAEFNPHSIKLQRLNEAGEVVKNKKGEIDRAATSSETLFEDFHNYSKDIIEKFLKTDKKDIKPFLKERLHKASLGRMGLAAMAFLAVGGFLLYLPKVYQRGKTSPAQQSAQRAQQEGGANESK